MTGEFRRLLNKSIVETLTNKLELAQEQRIAQTIFGLSGRSTTLSGTGSAKVNKWGNGGGDPGKRLQSRKTVPEQYL
jgi:NAD(P)H-hydrate repair Nnr-like enzyme with NAD(P)H-hydrate dehydratase domain